MRKDGSKCREEVLESVRALAESAGKLVEVFDREEKRLASDDLLQTLQKALCGRRSVPDVNRGALGADSIVQLNVGGNTDFVTTRATFTCMPSSRLGRIFKEGWEDLLPKDPDGRIFLDLDPLHFRVLMDWLADVKQLSPEEALPPHPVALLRQEQRYGFSTLCRQLGVPSPESMPSTVKGLFKAQRKPRVKESLADRALRAALSSTVEALQSAGQAPVAEVDALKGQSTTLWQKIEEWHDSLAHRRSGLQSARAQLPEEFKFLQHLAGHGGTEEEPEIIQLNVRGVRMSVLRATLLQDPNCMLAAKFSKTWTVQATELVNGAVFFDQDPELFAVALQFLRMKSLGLETSEDRPMVHPDKHSRMMTLLRYLALQDLDPVVCDRKGRSKRCRSEDEC